MASPTTVLPIDWSMSVEPANCDQLTIDFLERTDRAFDQLVQPVHDGEESSASVTLALATSPAWCPPMPSATAQRPRSARTSKQVLIDLPAKAHMSSADAFEGHPGTPCLVAKGETSNCQSFMRFTFF